MPPPPLTDDEVRQCILAWWEGEYVKLGIDYEVEGLPDNSAPKETWLAVTPTIYRREWERAYRFGLADDALQSILTRLGAPHDPDTPLVQVLSDEDHPKLFRAIKAMCDTEEVYAWGLQERVVDRRNLWLFVPFAASIVCLGIAVATGEARWAIGWPLCCLVGIVSIEFCKRSVKARPTWHLSPKVTFRYVAENIQETARNRAEEMLEVAQSFRQNKGHTQEH